MKGLLALTASLVVMAVAVALTSGPRPTRPERPISASPDAGPPPAPGSGSTGGSTTSGSFTGVAFARSRVLLFELRAVDFEDARGRGCPLEAVVDEPDAGEMATLRFRCGASGGP